MKALADSTETCKLLIKNIHLFAAKNIIKKDYHASIEQIFKFCKKLSKQPKARMYLVEEEIYEICLRYIQENLNFSKVHDQALKEVLLAIADIMKMIRNVYQSKDLSDDQKQDIFTKVTQRRQIITDSDLLLRDSSYYTKDDLAVIIINIIVCYVSISSSLELA
mmetsp:Transcript_16496/g.25481  ORF Transcript_16496/g.25481 Transcript_16496/m.25481 type:complete len:164 (-) Transcript_16496:5695-6186(-)